METNMIDVREWLAENKQVKPSGVNQHVQERVNENLETLIPPGIRVSKAAMNVFGFGVEQLCQAEGVNVIDWVALTNLAASISTLWNAGFTKELD